MIGRTVALMGTALASGLALRRITQTFKALDARRQPDFFYDKLDDCAAGVPVFTYHSIAPSGTPDSVTAADFERHMRYLAENDYQPLHAADLVNYLTYQESVPRRSVVITFDDGRASLWTTAYPILKRYGLRAVCFLVPGLMPEGGVRPVDGDSTADTGDTPMLTWAEVSQMRADGLIDFQSHSLNHTLIYTAPVIVDFFRPGYRGGYHHFGIPAIRWRGTDLLHTPPPSGTPIYRSQSRLSAARRYYDDEPLRQACIDYVAEHGGDAFFERDDWRKTLLTLVTDYHLSHRCTATFETEAEQIRAIRHSLRHSKRLIESHLPGHTVRHLCYPWHRYSILAASLAREAGYVSAFIDINPQKPSPSWRDPYTVQHTLPGNEPGDDPYQITRMDARPDLPLSLPGAGRLTYRRRFAARLLRIPTAMAGANSHPRHLQEEQA